jgi:hypothetical protein
MHLLHDSGNKSYGKHLDNFFVKKPVLDSKLILISTIASVLKPAQPIVHVHEEQTKKSDKKTALASTYSFFLQKGYYIHLTGADSSGQDDSIVASGMVE